MARNRRCTATRVNILCRTISRHSEELEVEHAAEAPTSQSDDITVDAPLRAEDAPPTVPAANNPVLQTAFRRLIMAASRPVRAAVWAAVLGNLSHA